MGCCEEWKQDCDQGRSCPIRRVRAGAEPPPDMPVQFAEGHEEDHPYLDESPAWWELAIVAFVLVVVMAVIVYAIGGAA